MKKIIVGISGASSVLYAQRLLHFLSMLRVEVHLIISATAKQIIEYELAIEQNPLYSITQYAYKVYQADNFFSPLASGSFLHDGMVIIPCSMNTLAHIAQGITSSLLHRAADVCIKEGRPLIVIPREAPLSRIHLQNMLFLCEQGVTVMPPTLALYNKPQSIVDAIDAFVLRILDILHIEHDLGSRWGQSG